MWTREPLIQRIARFVAWTSLALIVISISGGLIWHWVAPFLPLLAVIALFIAFSWFAFRRRQ